MRNKAARMIRKIASAIPSDNPRRLYRRLKRAWKRRSSIPFAPEVEAAIMRRESDAWAKLSSRKTRRAIKREAEAAQKEKERKATTKKAEKDNEHIKVSEGLAG